MKGKAMEKIDDRRAIGHNYKSARFLVLFKTLVLGVRANDIYMDPRTPPTPTDAQSLFWFFAGPEQSSAATLFHQSQHHSVI